MQLSELTPSERYTLVASQTSKALQDFVDSRPEGELTANSDQPNYQTLEDNLRRVLTLIEETEA